jgi:hypothetical protein
MESLRSYLTIEGWRKDWNQTRYDFGDFFSKNRRPKIGGIIDPSEIEIQEYLDNRNNRKFLDKIEEAHFSPKFFEKSCRVYEALGVRLVKKVIMNTVGKNRRKTDKGRTTNYFVGNNRNISSLMEYDKRTRENELMHGFIFVCGIGFITSLYFINDISLIPMYIPALGITYNEGNIVMLQRYNRARAYNTIENKISKKD